MEGVGSAKARNTGDRAAAGRRQDPVDQLQGRARGQQGDLLARSTRSTFKAQLDQAMAKKAQDESAARQCQARPRALQQPRRNVIAAKQQVDTQRALVAQLEAQMKSDDAAIDNARAMLGYTRIVAPISGEPACALIDEGNIVRASERPASSSSRRCSRSPYCSPCPSSSCPHQQGAWPSAR